MIYAPILLLLFFLPLILIIRTHKIRKRERLESQQKVQEAREQILADGKIEGPKGPYVPFKRWDVGTPHETRSAKQKAFHSDSWH